MKLNNRLAQAETRIARRQRRTLIAMQDNSDADLYHAHGVTYTLAELERLSESGWHIIRIVYSDEESTIAGETRRQITFDPTGETGTGYPD